MDSALTAWVSNAARLPVAFSQVREDPVLDLEICRRLRDGFEGILIASGGCTAAYLAARSRASRLHLVDMNPAQIALARLKLRLLETCEPDVRLAILGHSPMPAAARAGRIASELSSLGLPSDCLGPVDLLGSPGPDHMGRYEVLFSKLREELSAFATEISELLSLDDPAEQALRTAPSTALGSALDQAFDRVMTLPILVELFGDAATQNRVVPFSRHFAGRTRHVLATLPAASNPYLAQVLLGRFAGGSASP
ncbi:MAG TPA: DUF3419 family protein [Planctomycetota bacterium]|nr:DUF3419 family protein [Planctomycetota bacterium]